MGIRARFTVASMVWLAAAGVTLIGLVVGDLHDICTKQ